MESKDVILKKNWKLREGFGKGDFLKQMLKIVWLFVLIWKRSGLTILLLNDLFFSGNSKCRNLIIGKNLSLSFESLK